MREWEGDRSNYIIVGNVLQPRFVQQVEEGRITEFLTRFAAFVERVCADGDDEAINVVWVRIFEWLIFHPIELKFVWPMLGRLTKLNIKDAAGDRRLHAITDMQETCRKLQILAKKFLFWVGPFWVFKTD